MSSSFIGDWIGSGNGPTFGRLHVRIEGTSESLYGFALSSALDGESEVIEVTGKESGENRAVVELVNYVSDGWRNTPPQHAQITLSVNPDENSIKGTWATDLGNHGEVHLRKAVGWENILLRIPLSLHKIYRKLKKYLFSRFRYYYFFSVVALALLSIFGYLTQKISTNETVIILLPLVFMFSDKLQNFVKYMALRKVGPIEFQDQAKPIEGLNLPRLVSALHGEFGERTALFSAITEFFVPRTKYLLRIIVSVEKSISINEFNSYCAKIGISTDNVQATLDALIQTGCISVSENGEITPQDTAREFLDFENRLSQIRV